MKLLVKSVAIVIVATLMVTTLFGAFQRVSPAGVDLSWLNIGGSPKVGNETNFEQQKVVICVNNKTMTSYVRQRVFTNYIDGSWTIDKGDIGALDGLAERLSTLSNKTYVNVTFSLSGPVSGWLPTFKNLYNATSTTGALLQSDMYDMVGANGRVNGSIFLHYVVQEFDERLLKDLTLIDLDGYMDVPEDLQYSLTYRLDAIGRVEDPYQMVKKICQNISEHTYSSKNKNGQNLTGDQLLTAFLNGNADGNSLTFATAFVLLSRMANVPARLVQGYHINANVTTQYIDLGSITNKFYYAEVYFPETGWMTVNPTPLTSTSDSISGDNGSNDGGQDDPVVTPTTCRLSGYCFIDADRDGVRDFYEKNAPYAWIYLDNATQRYEAIANETGYFYIPYVLPGEYFIHGYCEDNNTMKTTYVQQWRAIDGTMSSYEIEIPLLDNSASEPWGVVYYDKDHDGGRDANENGMEGVVVHMFCNGTTGTYETTRTTGPSGAFSFSTDVTMVNCTIWIDVPDGWTSNVISYGLFNDVYSLRDVNFGLYRPDFVPYATNTTLYFFDDEISRGISYNIYVLINSTVSANGLRALAYLSPDKDYRNGILIGAGVITTGTCAVRCHVPLDAPFGNFNIIVRTIGNDLFAGSDSDPVVRVKGTSYLEAGDSMYETNKTVMVPINLFEYGTHTPIAGEEVHLQYLGTTVSATTDEKGIALVPMYFTGSGRIWIDATYYGSNDWSTAMLDWPVTAYDRELTVYTDVLVIGEMNTLSGALTIGPMTPGIGNISIALGPDAAIEFWTETDGSFTSTVIVPSDLLPGERSCEVRFAGNPVSSISLTLLSRPMLEIDEDERTLKVTLLAENNEPLRDQTIWFETPSGRTSFVTDNNGKTIIPIDRGTSYTATLDYDGNALYASTSRSITISAKPFDYLILLPFVVIGIGAVAAYGLRSHWKEKREETAASASAEPVRPALMTSDKISFSLGNAEGMPLVWREDDPLLLIVKGQPGPSRIDLGDGTSESFDLKDGPKSIEKAYPRGEYMLTAVTAGERTEGLLRAVDYREEVVSLFQQALAIWKEKDPGITDGMCARELYYRLKGTLPERSLDELVRMFELAEYSHHPIGRAEYETAWKAFKDVTQ
ncbi:MAG: Transglutaminase-like superfamily protein [Methanomassiliicoccales archaeon PtaU1.Bin124]|nr:MAG: Transglutaminase-like superfamily protein [Methanomassiliicoccales archaeon PtaU1.Bin124]